MTQDFTDYSPKDNKSQVTDLQSDIPDCFQGLEEECSAFLSAAGVDLAKLRYKYKPTRNPSGSYVFTLVSEKSGRGKFDGHRIMARFSYSPLRGSWAVGYVFNREYDCYNLDSALAVFWEQLAHDVQLYLK